MQMTDSRNDYDTNTVIFVLEVFVQVQTNPNLSKCPKLISTKFLKLRLTQVVTVYDITS